MDKSKEGGKREWMTRKDEEEEMIEGDRNEAQESTGERRTI